MNEELKIYLQDELELVEKRIAALGTDIKQKLAAMNLEMGKAEGILIAQEIRRDELLVSLGVKKEDEEIPEGEEDAEAS